MKQTELDFSHPRMEEGIASYFQTALDFTEDLPNGDPMSVVYTVDDFAESAVAYVELKIKQFKMNPLIERIINEHGLCDGVIGARLWTIRSGHGINFWDDLGDHRDTYTLNHAAKVQGHIEVVVVGGPNGCLNLLTA